MQMDIDIITDLKVDLITLQESVWVSELAS